MGGDLDRQGDRPDRARTATARSRRDVPRRDARGHRPRAARGAASRRSATTACTRGSRRADEIARHRADDAAARASCSSRSCSTSCGAGSTLADERMAAVRHRRLRDAGKRRPVELRRGARARRRTCRPATTASSASGDHEMISCSYANPTPWNSPRELDEDELYARIKRARRPARGSRDARSSTCTCRRTTRGSTRANEINPDLTLVYESGQPTRSRSAATAVRQIIEEYQPLLALHGHIHESRGAARIGRTLCHQLGLRVQQRPHPRGDREARGRRRCVSASVRHRMSRHLDGRIFDE